MSAGAVWLNGENVRDLGFIVADLPRFLDPPVRTVPVTPVPGRAGGVLLGRGVTEPRELQVVGTFVGQTAALREAAEAALKAVLATGLVEIRVRDASGTIRVTHGVPVNRAPLTPIGGLFVTRGTRWVQSFLCEDATWRAEEPTIVALGPTARTVTASAAATDMVVRAFGSATAATLDCRTAGGVLTTQMGLGNLGATAYIEVDTGAESVSLVTAGTAANGLSVIGDDPFPEHGLTPADGVGQTVAVPNAASGDLWYWARTP